MRIVFMGTPAFAVPSLRALLEQHQVLAVLTQPDKPQGRKMQVLPSPIKQLAIAHGIAVWQPQRLRGNVALAQDLNALAPDAIVVVAYGQILPPELLQIPRLGCINVHASLLPRYRGAAPIQWAILNGETTTGVCTMQMDEGLDTGDVLLTTQLPITQESTAEELAQALSEAAAPLLLQTLAQREANTVQPQPQDSTKATWAPPLTRALAPLDLTRPARVLHNQVRALQPWPGATLDWHGQVLKVTQTCVRTAPTQSPLCLRCGDGQFLDCLQVQPPGKRRMLVADFLRGLH